MSLLLQLLAATVLIAVFMLLRLVSNRQVTRQRMRRDPADGNCAKTECARGCEAFEPGREAGSGTGEMKLNRSAHHAP